jgi:hypothetical protein
MSEVNACAKSTLWLVPWHLRAKKRSIPTNLCNRDISERYRLSELAFQRPSFDSSMASHKIALNLKAVAL